LACLEEKIDKQRGIRKACQKEGKGLFKKIGRDLRGASRAKGITHQGERSQKEGKIKRTGKKLAWGESKRIVFSKEIHNKLRK